MIIQVIHDQVTTHAGSIQLCMYVMYKPKVFFPKYHKKIFQDSH